MSSCYPFSAKPQVMSEGDMVEIARLMHRQPGGIRSRLEKLDLK